LGVGEQPLAHQQITEPEAHSSTSKTFLAIQIVEENEGFTICLIFAKIVSSKKVNS
jgi:hypothetical protein